MKILLLFISILTFAQSLFANNWVDDWFDQKTGSNGGYYESDKRRYYYGGSFQGRTNLRTDPLITIEKPRLKFGCGNIDIFLGSMSVMDEEYMVKKAERIINASKYAILDIAIKETCPKCASTIHDITAIVDRINALQLDECKASKALAAYIMSPYSNNSKAKVEEDIASFEQSTGVTDLFMGVSEERRANDGESDQDDVNNLMSKCSSEVRDIFTSNGSLLSKVGGKIGYPEGHIEMLRGLFGDIRINTDQGFQLSFDPPCAEDQGFDLTRFINGEVSAKRSGTGANRCEKARKGSTSLQQWTYNTLIQIAERMKGRQAVTSEQENFIKNSDLPLLSLMRMSTMTGMEQAVSNNFSNLLAKSQSYRMLTDLFSSLAQIDDYLSYISTNSSKHPKGCSVEIIDDATRKMTGMSDSLKFAQETVREDYRSSVKEAYQLVEYLSKMAEFEGQATKKIKSSRR